MGDNPTSSSHYQSLEQIKLNELDNYNNIYNNMNDSTSLSEIPLIINSSPSYFFSNVYEDNNIESNKNTKKKEPKMKSGRKRRLSQENSNLQKKRRKSHDKFAKDNVKRKIQVNYIKFLVNYINKIIKDIYIIKNNNNEININKKLIEKIQFKSLDYNFMKKIDNSSFTQMKSKSIKEIIIHNTSPKIRNFNNNDVYNNIIKKINDIDIDILLNKKYLDFFDVYFKNKENINLKEYGLNDLNISLINIKKFDAFIEEQKKNTENIDNYIQRIKECIKTHFRSNHNLFLVKTE